LDAAQGRVRQATKTPQDVGAADADVKERLAVAAAESQQALLLA
jgi:hypothetical protein